MKQTGYLETKRRTNGCLWIIFFLTACVNIMGGCAVAPKKLVVKDIPTPFEEGAIIDTRTGTSISYEALMTDIDDARIIYIGEQHTNQAHHEIQLKIIKTVCEKHPDIAVGMEMFDHTYQRVLDLWSAGELDQEKFLVKVHWYANWKYNYDLYGDILSYIKNKNIKLIALNIPFHIPPKIREGGIENLSDDDKRHLPADIDTSDAAHKAYVENIFKNHHFSKRIKFEYFYMAQCVWEDAMAASIAQNRNDELMIVLTGNGHIIRKFGIPNRAFRRTDVPFRTIYLAPVGNEIERDVADYIWVTTANKKRKK